MAEPKKKLTSTRSGNRRSHLNSTKPIALAICEKCKKHIRPHRVCPFCGYYKAKVITQKNVG